MLSASTKCPGLFYATPAQDGILSRLRIPGGILNIIQCRLIADLTEELGGGYVDVTNRANLQIREIKTGINSEILQKLQAVGIGAINPNIDQIRNIMTSPTAGIDVEELIDTRPLVQAWDDYIVAHPHLAGLSAKFSVGFDGGGKVAVSDRLNDITLAAELVNSDVYFRLYLSFGEKGEPPKHTGILLKLDECIPVLAALADVYLAYTDSNSRRKPRLREIINNLGLENYLLAVRENLKFQDVSLNCIDIPLNFRDVSWNVSTDPKSKNNKCFHIGIHPQRQNGLFYFGVVLPLGRLESYQLRGLADISEKYGQNQIRLTPWQNVIIPDIPQEKIPEVETAIINLGLSYSISNVKSALIACSGKTGCASAATDTKNHALALAAYLEQKINLDSPVNIHFTGCEKSCAQHQQSDITLLGVNLESYHVYLGDGSLQKFGRQISANVDFVELPALIEIILKLYQQKRLNAQESFKEFIRRYANVQELFI
ncbi:MAG TPA: precorrin-3B synthase [Nostocaceae cyanobacterium]|nr:precorrin-3B synthase [Nostocaceae cyanobacterium]